MMKSILLLFASLVLDCGTSVVAFAPPVVPTPPPLTQTKLDATRRRDVLASLLLLGSGATTLFVPDEAKAFSQQLDDYAYEPHQQATDGKFDLNSAFVGDYKQLRGMFPTAAGKIASHGPYTSVHEIYDIPGLTKNDIDLFKKYEKEFTIHPPGRSFYERINARVST